jgi:ribosomal protein S18 acetylase RimI-like enzyme
MTEIVAARFPDDVELVRELFREYAAGLGVDLSFQDFETELGDLPGSYAHPRGRVLLAVDDGRAVGCVAMRPLTGAVCEMKRLYVSPAGRGRQTGRRLALALCQAAKEAGYTSIRLDTLPQMQAAQRLYSSLGFEPIAAYVFNPIAGTKYMELKLIGADFA